MRDHLLGWPGLLALIEPEAKPPTRGLGQNLPDPFETEDWTHVGAHLYGAAQAPQSESSRAKEDGRRDVSSAEPVAATPEAAPPSGQWVLTSERKPPKADVYFVKVPGHKVQQREWTGTVWRWIGSDGQPAERWGKTDCYQGWPWLDTSIATPQPDADGWIEHKGGGFPKCLKTGMLVDIRTDSGSELKHFHLVREDGPGWFPTSGRRITHYRVVTA